MKLLSPRVHGYLDLVVIAAFALAPTLLGFGSRAASLCYVLAALHATLTVLTAFPMGLLKMIPFPVHGALEAVMAPLLVATPWLVGFSGVGPARSFYIASGMVLGAVWLLTDYRAGAPDREHLPDDRVSI
ncbi:MAG: hypothetical protein EPO40_35300 [Myxococcaceae bacterium]|nr:MAG: hypothetical protein EPO40_35300 [Myxococcaceae bacterium]